MSSDLFHSAASREGRDALAGYLRLLAEDAATGSRDFGRGFMHAIKLLEAAPVRCMSCPHDAASPEGPWKCPQCGRHWNRVPGGWMAPRGG